MFKTFVSLLSGQASYIRLTVSLIMSFSNFFSPSEHSAICEKMWKKYGNGR